MDSTNSVADRCAADKENYFSIPVVHNRIKNNQVTALHLMIALLCIVPGINVWLAPPVTDWVSSRYLSAAGLFFTGLGGSILLLSLFFNKKVIQQPRRNLGLRLVEIIALLIIIAYAIIQHWWMPLAYSGAAFITIAFAYFWEKSAQKEFFLQLRSKEILLPRFLISRPVLWQDIQKVIIKHNILTIVRRDNKIFQFRIRTYPLPETEAIIAFCEARIDATKALYQEDW